MKIALNCVAKSSFSLENDLVLGYSNVGDSSPKKARLPLLNTVCPLRSFIM